MDMAITVTYTSADRTACLYPSIRRTVTAAIARGLACTLAIRRAARAAKIRAAVLQSLAGTVRFRLTLGRAL